MFSSKLLTLINNIYEKNNTSQINNLINETKEVYLNEVVEKKTNKLSSEQISNFSVRKMPSNIQQIIENIENNCKKLNNSKDIEIQHVVDQTIDKLLPETLKKYSMIDDDYKTSMTNRKGKNATDLLIESLNNINSRLTSLLKEKNNIQLTEMEINATFTQKLKNNTF